MHGFNVGDVAPLIIFFLLFIGGQVIKGRGKSRSQDEDYDNGNVGESPNRPMTWEEMERQYGIEIQKKPTSQAPPKEEPVVIIQQTPRDVQERSSETTRSRDAQVPSRNERVVVEETPAPVSTWQRALQELDARQGAPAAAMAETTAWEPTQVQRRRKRRALPLQQGILWSVVLGPCKAKQGARMPRI